MKVRFFPERPPTNIFFGEKEIAKSKPFWHEKYTEFEISEELYKEFSDAYTVVVAAEKKLSEVLEQIVKYK